MYKQLFSDVFKNAIGIALERQRRSEAFAGYRLTDPHKDGTFYNDSECLDIALRFLMTSIPAMSTCIIEIEKLVRFHEQGLLNSRLAMESVARQTLTMAIEMDFKQAI